MIDVGMIIFIIKTFIRMETDILSQIGMSSSGIALVLIGYKLFKYFKGHMLVSKCCGRKLEVGFDVRDMDTPIINPMIVVNGTTNTPNPERKQTDGQTVQDVKV